MTDGEASVAAARVPRTRAGSGVRPGAAAAYAAVAALALVSYLWKLGRADWLGDEILYAQVGSGLRNGIHVGNLEHPPLAKLLFGLTQAHAASPLGPRLVVAAMGLLICVVLYLLVRAVSDWRWALGAVALWLAVPHTPVQPLGTPPGEARLDRFGMLDPVATAFALLALWLGWRWSRAPSVPRAVVTGLVAGLAVSSKLTGGLVAPVIVVLALVSIATWRARLSQLAAFGATALATYVAAYLPFGGSLWSAMVKPITQQAKFASAGHRIELAGRTYDSAPWWAHLNHMWRADGPVVTIALGLLLVAALTRLRDRMTQYLLAALLLPFAVLASSPVAGPYYGFVWLPQLIALAMLGLRSLAARSRLAVLPFALVFLVSGVQQLTGVLRLQSGPYTASGCVLDALPIADGRVVDVLGYRGILHAYYRNAAVGLVGHSDEATAPLVDAVVQDPSITRKATDPFAERQMSARAFVAYAIRGFEIDVDPELLADPAVQRAVADCGAVRTQRTDVGVVHRPAQ